MFYLSQRVSIVEVFKTCALIAKTAEAKKALGEKAPENGGFSIDPDGSGAVPAFEVDCKFPYTQLPVDPCEYSNCDYL